MQTADRPWSLTSSAPGEFRFEIRADDHWRRDGPKTERRRSEISSLTAPRVGYSSFRYDLKVEPQAFQARAQYVLGQRHGTADREDARGEHPELAFRLDQGGLPVFTVCGSNQQPLVVIPKSITVWRGRSDEFLLGRWHRMEIRSVSGGSSPYAELWIDGERKARHEGEVGYVNAKPPYWKFGIYDALPSDETSIASYRNVQLITAVGPPRR